MIVLDTDFLSSFLKIDKLELVNDFFGGKLYIPIAVLREISQTDLIEKLNQKDYVKVRSVRKIEVKGDIDTLGKGELECITLASKEDLLLMDDKKAGKIAEENNISVVNIPGFLLSLKKSKHLTQNELNSIIHDLKEKDHHSLPQQDEERLRGKRR